MNYAKFITIAAAAAALMTPACTQPEPAQDPAAQEASRVEAAAAELQRTRNEAAQELDKRVGDLNGRWTDMEGRIAKKTATATAAMRAEVKEDVQNVREAVADLKTTTAENWWERHERAMERTAGDIEADVRRLTKGQARAEPPREPQSSASAAPFTSRRDQFVARLRARTDAMESQLKNVRARAAQETELDDTRERINKLKDDIGRLSDADADDWWDVSSRRVKEYVDRVESSVRRLDDNKP